MKNIIYLFLCVITFLSCKNTTKTDNELLNPTLDILDDSTETLVNATIIYSENINDISTDKLIISCPENYKEALKQYLEHEREQWKDVLNPFVATYTGNDFGDYHQINFKDSDGKSYDFGFGNNDFGDTQLYYEDENMYDNPRYFGKSLEIFWEWKRSTFPCCEGERKLVEAYLPSITKIELVDDLPKNRNSNTEIRIGKHNLTLQWISWDAPGAVTISKNDDNTYKIIGEQLSEENNNDYLEIDGTLSIISSKELVFNGTIKSVVSYVNNGDECVRTGEQIFKSTKGRQYWRLQNMINCEGGAVTDYVDIYFD